MERSVGIERSFFISDFNILKVLDSYVSLPEDVANNNAIVNKIKLLQLLEAELTFRKYLKLKEKLDQLPIEDSITKLEELSVNLLDEIRELLKTEE